MEPKKLSKEEEADEIVRRLKAPPKKILHIREITWTFLEPIEMLDTTPEFRLRDELADALRDEIDKEMLEWVKNQNTKTY